MAEKKPSHHTNDIDPRWPQVLETLKGAMSKNAYNAHFLGSKGQLNGKGELIIWLPPTANIEAIEKQLGYVVERAVMPIFGDRPIAYQIAFPDLPTPAPPPPPIRDTKAEFALLMLQEYAADDIVSFKRVHVQMCGGDTLAGLVLSNLVFWHTPNREGKSKLRVHKDDYYWVAKTASEWEQETTLSPKQITRAINKLVDLGLVVKKLYKFDGAPTIHLRLDESNFVDKYHAAIRS